MIPAHGAVKTRLASAVGKTIAQDLYVNFIHDMLSQLEKADYPFFICIHPEDALERLKTLLGEKHQYLPQKGDDLGQKMEYCINNAFSIGFRRVLLIGSDVPDLPEEIIGNAFRFLNTFDCVIGPSFDGGYYLIGFRSDSLLPEAFRGIHWGTDRVLKKTTDTLRRHHLRTHLLQTWRDIEYGLMQAYAEGFEILKARKEFGLDLHQVAEIWRHGSVVRSWLLDLTADALAEDQELNDIEGWVADSGEGRWAVFDASDLAVPAPVITLSLQMRFVSRQRESYAAKLLAAMRNKFGGHEVKSKDK